MSKLGELLKYTSDLAILRRILFATAHLPQDMPNYWQTIADFAKVGLPVMEVKTMVQNLQYLNEAAFSTDKKLLGELYSSKGGGATPIGVVLISQKQECGACGARLTVRADRPRSLVLYTQVSGTLPATHYRKVCSKARYGCLFVQHYGFHSEGKNQE